MNPAWLDPVLPKLAEINLAAGVGIGLVFGLRRPVLNAFGARAAYGLWLVPLLGGVAVLAPARLAPAPALPEVVSSISQAGPPPATSHAALQLDPDLAAWIWLTGAVIGAAWLFYSHLRFLGAERAGRAGPAVAGLLRPRIVLPADFAQRFEPAERAAILAHERAHLRAQDSRINALASGLACLCWFNPLVHLALRRLRLDQDLACDEAALTENPGQARLYATTLLKAQMQGQASPLACAFGAHPLSERIALAGRARPGRMRRLAGIALALVLGLGGAVAAWAAQPARPSPIAPHRTSLADAPTLREDAAPVAASRTSAARQLLADAVSPKPEGETMITIAPAPKRLAAAAVLALAAGAGSAQAAAPPPPAPIAPAPPRPVLAPREVPPPPPPPPRPIPVQPASPVATLVMADGTRIDCTANSGQCIEKLASLMKLSALGGDSSALATPAEIQALKAQTLASRDQMQAQMQTLKAEADAARSKAETVRREAQAQALKAQADAAARRSQGQ